MKIFLVLFLSHCFVKDNLFKFAREFLQVSGVSYLGFILIEAGQTSIFI